jgi:hypothetical protein
MISPEVKSFDSFVARMGEGKGQILTMIQLLRPMPFNNSLNSSYKR